MSCGLNVLRYREPAQIKEREGTRRLNLFGGGGGKEEEEEKEDEDEDEENDGDVEYTGDLSSLVSG